MRHALASAVFFALSALAYAEDPPNVADDANCGAFVPSSALKDVNRGTARIAYHVLADGSVAGAAVKRSSGYPGLDNAAQACISARLYNPEQRQGQAVESERIENISMFTPRLHSCGLGENWDKATPLKGISRVGFIIDASGRTQNIEIKISSGEQKLDDASKACIKLWHYLPAVKEDKSVSTPWEADIAWNMDSRPERRTDMTKCVRDVKLKPEDMAAVQNPTTISYTVIGGTVFDLKLEKSSGNKRLDNLALRCASRNRYRETVVVNASPGFQASDSINWKAVTRPSP